MTKPSHSSHSRDVSKKIQADILDAYQNGKSVNIQGGGSKLFYGNPVQGESVDVRENCGVVEYMPTELVVTARCGTRLSDLKMVLADAGQMLAFEPPSFSDKATLGGVIATGLSGPRRPFAGSVRDSVLGVKIINGQGEMLSFGGKVIKNVAGYDASRLMAGAQGTLGVLLEVSLKVLPRPEKEMTLIKEMPLNEALMLMNRLSAKPLPLSAAAFVDNSLYLRLSGSEAALYAAIKYIEHDYLSDDQNFWQALREQQHEFFRDDRPLWRLSVLPGTSLPELDGDCLLDWGGAQRWLKTDKDAGLIRSQVAQTGGHATLFRRPGNFNSDAAGIFHPLSKPLSILNQKIKMAFDPKNILNRNRLYIGQA